MTKNRYWNIYISGSPAILGPLLINIYTADLRDNLSDSISCYQYADDTTLYKQCSVQDLAQNVADFNNFLSHMASWSIQKLAKTCSKNWICCRKFCLWRHVNDIGDILKLNWLPVEERRDLLKLTFKALHAKQWPSHSNLQRVSICLLSSGSIRLQVPLQKRNLLGYCCCPF